MKDRLFFLLYLVVVVMSGLTHSIPILAGLFIFVLFLTKGDRASLKRAAIVSLIFGGTVAGVYGVFYGWWQFTVQFLLRMLLDLYFSFWIVKKVNFFTIFPRRVAIALQLSFSLMRQFQREFHEFWLGVRARRETIGVAQWREAVKTLGLYFLHKSFVRSQEFHMGMRSRGFFDD